SESARSKIAPMDGSETICLGQELGECYRFYTGPGTVAVAELQEQEGKLVEGSLPPAEVLARWREAVLQRVGWGDKHLWLLGQDAAFAAPLAKRFGHGAGILREMRRA